MLHWIGRLLGGGHVKDERMNELDSASAWAACLEHSQREPVFVFKHSTRCPVSTRAHSEVQKYLAQPDTAPVYINYVVEARPVAQEIAKQLGVQHESPQLMLVSGGKSIWNTSHGGVRADALSAAIETANKAE